MFLKDVSKTLLQKVSLIRESGFFCRMATVRTEKRERQAMMSIGKPVLSARDFNPRP